MSKITRAKFDSYDDLFFGDYVLCPLSCQYIIGVCVSLKETKIMCDISNFVFPKN